MPRYKVKNQYTFFGKRPNERYLGGHILTLPKEGIEGQGHKVEEIPRDKKDNAEPVAKSIDKPSVDKMVKQPEEKKTVPAKPEPPKSVPAKSAQANVPKPKPKRKPKASTKSRVVARKD